MPVIKASSSSFGVEAIATPLHEISDFEPLIESFSRQPHSGLIFPTDQWTSSHKDLVLEAVTRYRLPAIYAAETFARSGGLISYGFDQEKQFRQAAIYVDRILKGAIPGDLPIQQPTKFPLIVILSAARALGIELPSGLLLNADEVIE